MVCDGYQTREAMATGREADDPPMPGAARCLAMSFGLARQQSTGTGTTRVRDPRADLYISERRVWLGACPGAVLSRSAVEAAHDLNRESLARSAGAPEYCGQPTLPITLTQ